MIVNGEKVNHIYNGKFVGLNLNKPLYIGGAPIDDYAGFRNSYSGNYRSSLRSFSVSCGNAYTMYLNFEIF